MLYFVGSLKHDDHLLETGRLYIEGVVNASIVVEGLKLVTNRDRPNQGTGKEDSGPTERAITL